MGETEPLLATKLAWGGRVMDLQLQNKVAFIAGSTRGIGRAIAQAFLAEGANVVVTGRQEKDVQKTASAFKTEFGNERVLEFSGDLCDSQLIAAVVAGTREQWGGIDCLVANVGSGTARPGWRLEHEDWDGVFETNFWSCTRVVEAVLPMMIERGHGSIVMTSSIVGVESVNAPLTYSAAKAAMVNYSKNLARGVGPNGIRVNCIAPGNILFPGGSWEKKLQEKREFFANYVQTEVALQRFGAPHEIANLVVFLASSRADFITGACVVADGGQTRGI